MIAQIEMENTVSVQRLFDLSGRVALVTGGSRGLGIQIAEALGELGARVVIAARSAADLENARSELRSHGADVQTIACDITQPAQVTVMIEKIVNDCGRVDILVNNAGAGWAAPAEDHPLEAWQKLLNLNLTGTFLVTQAVGRLSMIPNRYGRVITVASAAGLRGNTLRELKSLGYNTTKGGLVNFTRALAGEWGAYNINVNALAPGFFPTKLSNVMLDRVGTRLIERTPLRRLGGEQDLKGVVALLASDASSFITGQIIAVDGGLSAV